MAQESSSFVKLGSGLVEIAALTALIGSATAESLTLGNKGAPGLAWAASSTFGALSVVKACVAGATPGWLRDSLGVRNTTTDLAIGLSFDLESRYKDREDMARKNLGDPIGVMCEGYRVCYNLAMRRIRGILFHRVHGRHNDIVANSILGSRV